MIGIGYGRRRLINKIVNTHWNVDATDKQYNYNEVLFLIQELLTEEGKPYMEIAKRMKAYQIFDDFVKHLLYRNLANYDSMVLLTSDKGCITGDALLEMPRDLIKYPRGIPLKELVGKGPQYVYSFNVSTEKLELKKCDGVEFVKEDDVWEIELTNGMKIKATKDHPFLLKNKIYKKLNSLYWKEKKRKNGKFEYHRHMINGKLVYTDRLTIFCRPHKLNDNNIIKVDYSKIDKANGDTTHKHNMMEPRFIMKELFGDIGNNVVHHKNHNHFDNRIENLELLDGQSIHFSEHNMERFLFEKNNKFCYNTGYSSKKKEKIRKHTEEYNVACSKKRKEYCENSFEILSDIAKEREKNNINSNHVTTGGIIKSIKYIGKRNVYDVVGVQDNHNFIVNGFVVSNTGKSSAAIMLARRWCQLLGKKFDPKRHIAYNNSDVSNKIDMLNNFEPIICVGQNTKIRIKINGKEHSWEIKKLVNLKDYEVLTYNEKEDIFEYQKPKKTILTKRTKIWELELENGIKISATPEHKFLTKNRGYVELQNLTENDEVVLQTRKCKICDKEFQCGVRK